MRDIKFRGKRFYDKEWCFGWLLKDLENSTAYYQECPYRIIWYEGTAHCNSPVITETIGQYTGLKDANGKDIYGGDIVRWRFVGLFGDSEKYEISQIEFMKGSFFVTPKCKENSMHINWVGFGDNGSENLNLEIIGNIHDNPELMEGMK